MNLIPRPCFCRLAAAVALLGLTAAPMKAQMPINVNVPGVGFVGQIDVNRVPIPGDGTGLLGQFTAMRMNPDGTRTPIALAQLEKTLAEDHLNWFQKVVNNRSPGAPASFVDPPNGGLGRLWADNRPGYWDEVRPPDPLPMGKTAPPTVIPPAGMTELGVNIVGGGTQLRYSDAPTANADFATFLVSDYDNPVWGDGGPKTYKVLDGFTWSAAGGMITAGPTSGATFTQDMRNEFQNDFGWREAAAPDSSSSTPASPQWNARETASANALIIVQPTSNGNPINNANGSRVQYSMTVPAGSTSVVFQIPGVIDGNKVTDATQWTRARNDPGVLQFAAFDANNNIEPSFSAWLVANGYTHPHELDMPDFTPDPSSGLGAVYYSVNTAALGSAGESFVNSATFGESFTVGQLEAALPSYKFSSAPFDYESGKGWVGTPLDPNTKVDFNAFHQADVSTPEPSTFVLLCLGAFGLLGYAWRWRQHQAASGVA